MRGLWLVLFFSIMVGCGGPPPRMDTTNEETANASMKAMTAGMNEDQKKAFAMECTMLTFGDVMKQSMAGGKVTASQAFRTLNGLTVDEIHARVAAINAARK